MKTKIFIELIQKWSYDYIKMDCDEGKCYGVLAVSSSGRLRKDHLSPSRPGPSHLFRAIAVPRNSWLISHWSEGHPG